jgi:hypothetical protein
MVPVTGTLRTWYQYIRGRYDIVLVCKDYFKGKNEEKKKNAMKIAF